MTDPSLKFYQTATFTFSNRLLGQGKSTVQASRAHAPRAQGWCQHVIALVALGAVCLGVTGGQVAVIPTMAKTGTAK